MSFKQRLGNFSVTLSVFESLEEDGDNSGLAAFFSEFIPVSAVTNLHKQVVEYVAISKHFEKVDQYEEAPEYKILVTKEITKDGEDEVYSYSFEAVKIRRLYSIIDSSGKEVPENEASVSDMLSN